jgi:serine/threonine protein kinase
VGINDATKEKVAIKIIKKSLFMKEGSTNLIHKLELEITALQKLKHPNIVRLIDVVEQAD